MSLFAEKGRKVRPVKHPRSCQREKFMKTRDIPVNLSRFPGDSMRSLDGILVLANVRYL